MRSGIRLFPCLHIQILWVSLLRIIIFRFRGDGKLQGQENCWGFIFLLFSHLSFLFDTELILSKILTFKNDLSMPKGLISLKMLNNYENKEMTNVFLSWACRKKLNSKTEYCDKYKWV